jgi:excisionase family DNA binding protein
MRNDDNVIAFDRLATGRGGRLASVTRSGRAVYTVMEVAHLLALSRSGTYELIRRGVIPAERLGRRWVIPCRRFHAWLDGATDDPDGC